ncbi:MAG: CoA transferase [Pseudolabrys sp.]
MLIALAERERSGSGQCVQTSLLEAQIAMMDFQAARYLVDGVVPGQAGNDHPIPPQWAYLNPPMVSSTTASEVTVSGGRSA